MITVKDLVRLKTILEKDTSVEQISEESIQKMIKLFDVKAIMFKYEKTISDPLRTALEFYKEYDKEFYEIISEGILNDRILIGDFVKRSYVSVDKKLCFIKTEGNDHDVYVMIHEMAHYVNAMLNQKFIDRNNSIYTEVFSYYMERQLDKFLIARGYYEVVFARYQNRTYSTCETAKSLKNFLTLKRIYETNKLGLLLEQDRIEKVLRCDRNYPAQYYLRYLVGTIFSRRLAMEESDKPFIERIKALDLDEEIARFSKENVTLILK